MIYVGGRKRKNKTRSYVAFNLWLDIGSTNHQRNTSNEDMNDYMTPARKALLAYGKAWTYPILGNEDVPVMQQLFKEAQELASNVAVNPDDPPIFEQWLKTFREARRNSDEWEDALFAVSDYFGLSTEK
jgi:hypothetical protein